MSRAKHINRHIFLLLTFFILISFPNKCKSNYTYASSYVFTRNITYVIYWPIKTAICISLLIKCSDIARVHFLSVEASLQCAEYLEKYLLCDQNFRDNETYNYDRNTQLRIAMRDTKFDY